MQLRLTCVYLIVATLTSVISTRRNAIQDELLDMISSEGEEEVDAAMHDTADKVETEHRPAQVSAHSATGNPIWWYLLQPDHDRCTQVEVPDGKQAPEGFTSAGDGPGGHKACMYFGFMDRVEAEDEEKDGMTFLKYMGKGIPKQADEGSNSLVQTSNPRPGMPTSGPMWHYYLTPGDKKTTCIQVEVPEGKKAPEGFTATGYSHDAHEACMLFGYPDRLEDQDYEQDGMEFLVYQWWNMGSLIETSSEPSKPYSETSGPHNEFVMHAHQWHYRITPGDKKTTCIQVDVPQGKKAPEGYIGLPVGPGSHEACMMYGYRDHMEDQDFEQDGMKFLVYQWVHTAGTKHRSYVGSLIETSNEPSKPYSLTSGPQNEFVMPTHQWHFYMTPGDKKTTCIQVDVPEGKQAPDGYIATGHSHDAHEACMLYGYRDHMEDQDFEQDGMKFLVYQWWQLG